MEDSSAWIDISLYLGYLLTIVAVVAAVVLPLIKSMDNPKGLLKVAAGIVGLIVIFGIAYALSTSDAVPGIRAAFSEQTIKLVGASLVTMYILFIVAIVGIAVTEVSKFFR